MMLKWKQIKKNYTLLSIFSQLSTFKYFKKKIFHAINFLRLLNKTVELTAYLLMMFNKLGILRDYFSHLKTPGANLMEEIYLVCTSVF